MSTKQNTNEFAIVSSFVKEMVEKYRSVRKEFGIPDDGWHSRTIESIAKPFLKGYFTLAVVGKVSSGKSTFINALLGCKDLLPTGHDQTTSGITYIEYGDKPEAIILFGDGHSKTIEGDDLSGRIVQYVSIPEKYHNLPVNHIDQMILGGLNFNDIWAAHTQLEEETDCSKINQSDLREYVSGRKKADIATEVRIKFPFNKELKGWRVIDTPGIGAIGGIEQETRDLLKEQKEDGERVVDAIIFLQKGSETLDEAGTRRFVKEQLDNFTVVDKKRLFYVLTHSGSFYFRNNKKNKLEFIKANYGGKIKYLSYADGLMYSFLSEFKNNPSSELKYLKAKPDNWREDEWHFIRSVIRDAMDIIEESGRTVNNETILELLEEWAHFAELKKTINSFAKNEKKDSFLKIVELIAEDYSDAIKETKKQMDLLNGDEDQINAEFKKIEGERTKINQLARYADNSIRIDSLKSKFSFISEELNKIDTLSSITAVRTAISDLFDLVQVEEHHLFDEIKKMYSGFFLEKHIEVITIRQLDLEALEKDAEKGSYDTYVVSPEQTKKHTSKPEERIPAIYNQKLNSEKKLRQFKALVLKRARKEVDRFYVQLKEKADNLNKGISEELHKKLNITLSDLATIKELKDSNEYSLMQWEEKSKTLENAHAELDKFQKEYDE